MGVCVYPVLEKNIEGVEYASDGKMLAKILHDAAGRRAEEIGNAPLMSFFGFDPDVLFDEFDVPHSDAIRERWFSAVDGLKAVENLIEDLSENPTIYAADEKIAAHALEDLEEMQKVLRAASAENSKWYLAIDF
jgi:hypothetical protein